MNGGKISSTGDAKMYLWLSQIDTLSRAEIEKSELARDIEPARASAPAREGAKRRGCYLDA